MANELDSRHQSEYRESMAGKTVQPNTSKKFLYDIVWATRRNKMVLYGEIGDRLDVLLKKACKDLNLEILRMQVNRDYVWIMIKASSELSANHIAKRLKRKTARIKREFEVLRKMPSMWTRDEMKEPRELTIKEVRDYLADRKLQNAVKADRGKDR
jgi:REP element-mobilizing transposase RayT